MPTLIASIAKGACALICNVKRAALVLLSLFVLVACSGEAKHFIIHGETMGTTYQVTVLGDPEDKAVLAQEIDQLLLILNDIASTYIEDSELNQFNRAAIGEWHEVSPALYSMFEMALEVAWLSNGAFDITVGPLVNAWGFGPMGRIEKRPNAIAQRELLARVSYQHLELDLARQQVRKKQDIEVDLSAIAKGYAVDELAAWIERRGYENYLVEIGGELRVAGESPRGNDWRVAIESPDASEGVRAAIAVTDIAVATSGDYRNFYEEGGQRYSHTIDPRSGEPVQHDLASVTVLAETAAYADALATAFSVMGTEKTLKLAEQEGIAVYLIHKQGDGFVSKASSAFKPYEESL